MLRAVFDIFEWRLSVLCFHLPPTVLLLQLDLFPILFPILLRTMLLPPDYS